MAGFGEQWLLQHTFVSASPQEKSPKKTEGTLPEIAMKNEGTPSWLDQPAVHGSGPGGQEGRQW